MAWHHSPQAQPCVHQQVQKPILAHSQSQFSSSLAGILACLKKSCRILTRLAPRNYSHMIQLNAMSGMACPQTQLFQVPTSSVAQSRTSLEFHLVHTPDLALTCSTGCFSLILLASSPGSHVCFRVPLPIQGGLIDSHLTCPQTRLLRVAAVAAIPQSAPISDFECPDRCSGLP